MILAQTYTEIALVIIAVGALLQMLINNIGRKNQAEEARMNYRDGHVRGIQLYKEIWGIVDADYRTRNQAMSSDRNLHEGGGSEAPGRGYD